MSIVLAVNGIVEPYPARPRPPRVGSAEAQRERSSTDRSLTAAQTAYKRQARQEHSLRPAGVARDLMTTPVVTLGSNDTLADAWAMMQRKSFRHIPITSIHGALAGIVSDRDLLHHVPELISMENAGHAALCRLADIMSSRVISAAPTTDIREIARVMLDERINAIPILDANRRPIGILTSRDLLRGIAHHGPLELWT